MRGQRFWLRGEHVLSRRGAAALAALAALAIAAFPGTSSDPAWAPGSAVAGPRYYAPFRAQAGREPASLDTSPLTFSAAAGPTVSIPILVYHFIRVNPDKSDQAGWQLSVPPDRFAAQLAFLKAQGVRCLSPDEVFRAVHTGRQPNGRVAMLTFDDGFADFATTAVPLLVAAGCTATSYVVSGFIDKPGYMTSAQVRAVEARGMHVGAHTVHHVPLAQRAPSERMAEIAGSKAVLESLLRHPVIDFAYPYGSFNAEVEAQVKAAGFRDAVTTLGGASHQVADPFGIRRLHVNGDTTLTDFAALLGLRAAVGPSVVPPSQAKADLRHAPAHPWGHGIGPSPARRR